ncbi:hypothetical protein A1O3_08438 [Capronia epimyces CBS 606.96]|uniref:Zn(2)-C6 fungal-type domain-containing protein n=1 Tax=Capronia epimyces CBS 606.96 TaxID=1182542 RepID=W9XFF8_9EURO|nr:uncharacterized protein A1O3_08438 [Capronia epimyces CBS 606.96]EXJ78938.1 hypothetical protein A1O3_08438 [Capronia epimyces CBS 606.96]
MGNIGRPSTGCGLCRKRRVKCDEGRPGCRNCMRLNKPCPGYREPDYGLIRSTVFMSSPSSIPRASVRALQPSTAVKYEESGPSHSRSITSPPLPRPSFIYSTPDEVIEQALWYSLAQLDTNSRALYGNDTFNFLPNMLAKAGPESYLYSAMKSVGIINLANRSPTVNMQSMIDTEYAEAVLGVTAALADPELCLKDETLVSVWLLGFRELLASLPGSIRTNSASVSTQQTHIDGTLMLLRLRGERQFFTPEGRHLFAVILSSMHWKPLFASQEPKQEYLMLESQIPNAVCVVPPAATKVQAYFHAVCKLRARIKNFRLVAQNPSIDQVRMVASYLRAAARLEDKASGWCDIVSWLPRKVVIDPSHRPHAQTPWTRTWDSTFGLHWFDSWAGFYHWNRYFVANICLHAALLDALAALTETSVKDPRWNIAVAVSDLISWHTAMVHNTVRDFLGTFAYAFGDVDGHGHVRTTPTPVVSDGTSQHQRGINVPATLQIYAPLTYLVTLECLEADQRESMVLALQRVGAEFSLR